MTQNAINSQGLASATVASADEVIIYDNDDSGIPKKVTAQSIADLATEAVTWNEETTTSATMAVNNGYVANNAALVTLTLPATAAFGDVIRVAGKGAGLFRIAQNAGQTINFDGVATTTGATGSITALAQFDAIELLCITADTTFVVLSSVGNFTIA